MKLHALKHFFQAGLLIFTICLFALQNAYSCSCADPLPPCEAFGAASAVFVGRVVSSSKREVFKDETGNKTVYAAGKIHFAIEEPYSDNLGKEVDISNGPCGYGFKLGEVYLVYAYRDAKQEFTTSSCTRTRPFNQAAEDLAFLQNLPAKGTGVTIHGVVYKEITHKEGDQEARYDGLPSISITARNSGGQEFKTVTDDGGKYEFKGLKAGIYTVDAALPDYYQKGEYRSILKLKIVDRGCGDASFSAVFDGRISGVVVNAEGRPVAKGEVVLLSADKEEIPPPRHEDGSGYIRDQGRFEIREIRPGRYRLGIKVNDPADEEMPYPPVWYPGVPEKSQAMIIDLGPGQKFSDIVIKLPQKLIKHTIRGTVVWPNGKPVSEASVYLEQVEYPGRCLNECGNADKQGRFTLIGYQGLKYRIQANTDVVNTNTQSVYAVPFPIEIRQDITGLKIVLTLDQKTFEEKYEKKSQN